VIASPSGLKNLYDDPDPVHLLQFAGDVVGFEEDGARPRRMAKGSTLSAAPRLICTLEITPRGKVFTETFA